MRYAICTRCGFTLIEVLVSLAIMSILLGVVVGALFRSAVEAPGGGWVANLVEARSAAVRTGSAVVVWPDSASVDPPVLFLPDGRSVGEVWRPVIVGNGR